MGTELSPTIHNLNIPNVVTGIPEDLYDVLTTQKYQIGSVCRPNGSSYYYSKSGAACLPGYVNKLWTQVLDITIVNAAVVAGSNVIKVTNTSNTITENQYSGGYLVVGHGIAGGASTQMRRIVSNSPSAATPGTEAITFVLDKPFNISIASGVFCEVMSNEYTDVRGTTSDLAYPAGVAPAGVTAADMYFWNQTWGICWLAPGGGWTSQGVAGERQVRVVGDGSVNGSMTTAAANFPIVGNIIQRDTSGAGGPPFVDLRIKY